MKSIFLLFLTMGFLISCVTTAPTQDYWTAVSGSRADGIVSVTRDYKEWQDRIDDGAIELAKEKCALWGYTGAEWFSRPVLSCTYRDYWTSQCIRYAAETTFQCLGKPK